MSDCLISIIILNWNGRKWMQPCLDSIRMQTRAAHEVICVDNDSQDDSVGFVRERYPFVRIVRNDRNYGYAEGNNRGAVVAGGDILLFLNTDAKLKDDCLERLQDAVRAASEHTGIFALKHYSYDGKTDLYPGRRWMGVDFLGYPCLSPKLFYADGAALAVRKGIFDQLGGFDQAHFMFAEDVDLCWRARLRGYGLAGVEDAVVYHSAGGSTFDSAPDAGAHVTSVRKRYLAERNAVRNLLKNYSAITLAAVLPALVLSYLIESVLCLCLLRPDMIGAVYLKSLSYNISMLGDTLRARRTVQRQRTVSDLAVLKGMSFIPSKYVLFTGTRLRDLVVKTER